MLFGKIEALQVLQVTKYPFSTTQDQYGTACFVVFPQGIISGTNFVLTQSTLQASHTNTNVTIRCQKSLLVIVIVTESGSNCIGWKWCDTIDPFTNTN